LKKSPRSGSRGAAVGAIKNGSKKRDDEGPDRNAHPKMGAFLGNHLIKKGREIAEKKQPRGGGRD